MQYIIYKKGSSCPIAGGTFENDTKENVIARFMKSEGQETSLFYKYFDLKFSEDEEQLTLI